MKAHGSITVYIQIDRTILFVSVLYGTRVLVDEYFGQYPHLGTLCLTNGARLHHAHAHFRAGAPVELAEDLVRTDTPGINIVHSPLALRTWSESGYSGHRVQNYVPEYLTTVYHIGSLISTSIAERGKRNRATTEVCRSGRHSSTS